MQRAGTKSPHVSDRRTATNHEAGARELVCDFDDQGR